MATPEQFNLAELETIAAGDQSFILKMLETFSYSVPPFIEKMKEALAAKNLLDLSKTGHRLKPSFHYLGRADLNRLLAAIENGDGSKTEEEVYDATNKFLDGVAPMMIAVDEHIEAIKQK